jgi:hypothetical protein
MRAVVLATLVLVGCDGDPCKQGTLLVDVELNGDAAMADTLVVDVSTNNGAQARTQLDHMPGVATGRIEVDFPSGYPSGATVTVTLTAMMQGFTIGKSLSVVILKPGCDVTAIAVGKVTAGDGGVGGGGDGTPMCPAGGLFNEATMTCENSVPTDPEFKDVKAWTLSGGATIDPTAPGLDDVGELILDKAAVCTNGGSARQTITIPTFDASGTLSLIHTVERDCMTTGAECMGGDAVVRFRDGALAFPGTSSLVKSKTCLGARAYGATYDLVVAAGDKNDCNNPALSMLTVKVDRLSIVPDTACPPPSSIQDPGFDMMSNDWQLQLNNGTATIDQGIGVNGTSAGHITTSKLCQSPKLRGIQSVPMGPQVALQVYIKGTAGKAALVGEEANLPPWGAPVGTGVFETPKICVPEYAKGMVLPLILGTETPQGSCTTLDVRDFVFDDLSFVVEPSCPMTAFVIDPGFERHATLPQWNLSVNDDGATGMVAAKVVQDSGVAHGGSAALELTTKQFCTSAHANTVITVPAPTATGGPVLKFWYKAPLINNAIAFASVQSAQTKLTPTATWKQATVCLDPARAGQGQYLELVVGSSGICGKTFTEELAYFDDFEVSTDASCAAK